MPWIKINQFCNDCYNKAQQQSYTLKYSCRSNESISKYQRYKNLCLCNNCDCQHLAAPYKDICTCCKMKVYCG
ncbi:hypothetical protein [Spiroplasma endosymbiont of Diplazon laetatorius]|uniref:hypothetical protein n=1 Tax=Spiroplasma endosymbiont of Diplazon laetatorius TaxID=3066322 RepID=UPI0030CC1B96